MTKEKHYKVCINNKGFVFETLHEATECAKYILKETGEFIAIIETKAHVNQIWIDGLD